VLVTLALILALGCKHRILGLELLRTKKISNSEIASVFAPKAQTQGQLGLSVPLSQLVCQHRQLHWLATLQQTVIFANRTSHVSPFVASAAAAEAALGDPNCFLPFS